MHIRFEFKLADMWIGLFWKQHADSPYIRTDLWVCVLPCRPLHIWWNRRPV